MERVKVATRYDEEHMGFVWYVVVNDVATQGFDSVWDAITAGLGCVEDYEDKLDYLWDVSMCLAALHGGTAIGHYKMLLGMIGEVT